MTLIELLLASACTVSIVTAGTTMVLAVSYAAESTQSGGTVSIKGHGVMKTLRKSVSTARLVGYYDANKYTLWTNDANNDDKIQLSETQLTWLDDSAHALNVTSPFSATMTAAEIRPLDREVAVAEFQSAGFTDAISKSAMASTTVLCENAVGFSVSGNASGADAQLLDVTLKVTDGTTSKGFVTSAAPVAPADYLLDASKYTNDGNPAKRKRRLASRTWKVP